MDQPQACDLHAQSIIAAEARAATGGSSEAVCEAVRSRHCEERSDEEIFLSVRERRTGLLRFARNDEDVYLSSRICRRLKAEIQR